MRFKDGFPFQIAKGLDYPFVAKLHAAPRGDPFEAYDKGSLLVRAFRQFAEIYLDCGHDPLVECRYCLRPWLTPAFKRTEAISIVYTVLHGGKQVDLHFTYDPR